MMLSRIEVEDSATTLRENTTGRVTVSHMLPRLNGGGGVWHDGSKYSYLRVARLSNLPRAGAIVGSWPEHPLTQRQITTARTYSSLE
jgi:hypothetical protein